MSKEVMALNSKERQGRNHRVACCLSVLFISFVLQSSLFSSDTGWMFRGVCFFCISFCECHQGSDPHDTRHVINNLSSSLNSSLCETPWKAPCKALIPYEIGSLSSKSCVTIAFLHKYEPYRKLGMCVNSWVIHSPSSVSVCTYIMHAFTVNSYKPPPENNNIPGVLSSSEGKESYVA